MHGGPLMCLAHFLTCYPLAFVTTRHGLSQQGIWVLFWTPKPLKITPQDTQIFLCGISKSPNLNLIIEFSHLLIIPMTLFNDIMPYCDEFIHVYGWNMSILWYPLKIWTPKNFTTVNFRHPVSKSWLRHCNQALADVRSTGAGIVCLYCMAVGCAMQGLSQDLETVCPKLAIVIVVGVQFFKGDHNIIRFQQLTYWIKA